MPVLLNEIVLKMVFSKVGMITSSGGGGGGEYSRFQVTGMIEGCFRVFDSGIFFGGKIWQVLGYPQQSEDAW